MAKLKAYVGIEKHLERRPDRCRPEWVSYEFIIFLGLNGIPGGIQFSRPLKDKTARFVSGAPNSNTLNENFSEGESMREVEVSPEYISLVTQLIQADNKFQELSKVFFP